MNILHIKYTWIPAVIVLTIFYLTCLIPVKDIPAVSLDFFIPIDKIVHFLMFFGLSGATAFNYVLLKKGRVDNKKLIIGTLFLPVFYGGMIEILQANFFAPRTGDWFDFLADAMGSIVAYGIVVVYNNYLLKNKFQ